MLWKRETPNREIPPRVRKLDTPELIMWMDTTLLNVHQAFDAWRRHGKSFEQIGEAIDVLNSLWEEISSREVDKPKP